MLATPSNMERATVFCCVCDTVMGICPLKMHIIACSDSSGDIWLVLLYETLLRKALPSVQESRNTLKDNM